MVLVRLNGAFTLSDTKADTETATDRETNKLTNNLMGIYVDVCLRAV